MPPSHHSTQNRILGKVFRTIDVHRMIRHEDRVLLAVSGGVDSVVLTDILCRYGALKGIDVAIAHLNHSLRGENALRDARFVRQLAQDRNIAFFYGKADVAGYRAHRGLSLEDAGRRIRYRFLTRIAERHHFTRIATGHHLDDNAEVILMRLLRGSGRSGFSGIPAVRNGRIIRPLLDLCRREIRSYAVEAGLSHVEDETNRDESYLRNRIRHHLIPFIKEHYNADINRTLVRSALVCGQEDLLLDAMGEKALGDAVLGETATCVTVSVEKVKQHGMAVQRRMIRAAIRKVKGNTHDIGFIHIDAILKLFGSNLSGAEAFPKALHLPGRLWVQCDGTDLTLSISPVSLRNLSVSRKPAESAYQYAVNGVGTVAVSQINAKLRFDLFSAMKFADVKELPRNRAFLDMDLLRFPMQIRPVRSEDRFMPLGMRGHQSVHKFLADRKVPAAMRPRWPVVAWGDRIVWVAGHRVEHAFRITEQTQQVLSIELFLA